MYVPFRSNSKCLAWMLLGGLAALPARAQVYTDTGYFSETIVTLPEYEPVGLTWAPDGRMFIWQENGIIRVFKDGDLLPAPFADIGDHVNTTNDRGLLGLALDPDFARNGYVYLSYSYEEGGKPTSIGPKTGRITRIQADPANPDRMLAGSEKVILGALGNPPCSQYAEGSDCIGTDEDSHGVGTLKFAPDGKLIASVGDGSSYRTQDTLALRAQSLNRYEGKILRINPDGSAPGDNPFDDGTQSIRSKIYALGLRNPYRFGLDSLGDPYIGEVGSNIAEEVDHGRGANFGWPCSEGNGVNWIYVEKPEFALCKALDSAKITRPVYTYDRSVGTSAIGGSFVTGTRYPDSLKGNFFFGDYASSRIHRLVFDAAGKMAGTSIFASNVGSPVSIERGPDGYLYYIAFSVGGNAEIRRIGSANRPPVVKISASPQYGPSPLSAVFSSAGTVDPNGDSLAYQWDFGDGAASAEANPTHVYASAVPRRFIATLKTTNAKGKSAQAQIPITVGSSPPVVAITKPAPGMVFHYGDTCFFAGAATDPDQAIPDSEMVWTVILHHDEHVHQLTVTTGKSGFVLAENHGQGVYRLEIQLTATDATGLKATQIVETSNLIPPPGGTGLGTLHVTATPPEALISLSPSDAYAGIPLGSGTASWNNPPGTVWAQVSAPGYRTVRFPEKIADGATTHHDVALKKGAATRFRTSPPFEALAQALPAGITGALTFGDIDGDGGLDMALTGGDAIKFFPGAAGGNGPFGTFIYPPAFPKDQKLPGVAGLTLCDWDDDGRADLILGFADGRVVWGKRDGTSFDFSGLFQGPTTAAYPLVMDLDGDGHKDLLVNFGSKGVLAYRNTATGALPVFADAPVTVVAPEDSGDFEGPMVWEDLESDGQPELMGILKGRLRAYHWPMAAANAGGPPSPAWPPKGLGNAFDVNVSGAPLDCPGCKVSLWRPGSGLPKLMAMRPTGVTSVFPMALAGDVNGDGKVDEKDKQILLQAWQSVPGGTDWYPDADIEKGPDGRDIIDIFDLSRLGENWGLAE